MALNDFFLEFFTDHSAGNKCEFFKNFSWTTAIAIMLGFQGIVQGPQFWQ